MDATPESIVTDILCGLYDRDTSGCDFLYTPAEDDIELFQEAVDAVRAYGEAQSKVKK